ncbi:ferritin heavy polypeptide-like 17 [Chrysoperla carnea]|uniref:ferritin heavy polypeptide-like 17 n=1 Tax=Chrysoperla carnea TaxID=189513 RepID=UPI001D07AA56|nr:ferritin heavy polypeptide-like 17 [Chrysoperla carnea]
MKFVILITALAAVAFAEDEFCYQTAQRFCSAQGSDLECNAKYGGITTVLTDLQKYVTRHIEVSFDYLLLSTHFGNYEKERNGFKKLYRKLSDEKWAKSMDIIKKIAQRGGSMDFNVRDTSNKTLTFEVSELESLAKALDIEKSLAKQGIQIHGQVSHKASGTEEGSTVYDPEIGHYLEEEIMEGQAKNVRELSGYTNDLSTLLHTDGESSAISLFLFDEYLSQNI